MGLPAQSLIKTFKERKIGFEIDAKIQRKVFGTLYSRKGMFRTFDSDINKTSVLFYTKIIFRSGTKSYALVQHLSPVQKNVVLFIFHGWCSYDILHVTAGRLVRTKNRLLSFKSRSGNS